MILVVFQIKLRADADLAAYESTSERMVEILSGLPGFLGLAGFAAADGGECALAYFDSHDTVAAWKDHPEHRGARERGRNEFFESYDITVAEVARHYEWSASTQGESREGGPVEGRLPTGAGTGES